jgi:hypothetical protein
MNQREKIANSFSDEYLMAMLEGVDTSEVIRQFSKDFPEMVSEFEANANSLNLLYGDLATSSKPSANEISAAYKKISEKLEVIPAKSIAREAKAGFFAELKTFFSASPMWTGASLGIGVAVLIALLWQPWVIKESLKETAHNGIPSENMQKAPSQQQDFSFDDKTSKDPMKLPEVKYRGKTAKEVLTAAQKRMQDSIDAAHLRQMSAPKPLSPPANIQIEPLASGVIMVRWNASPDALSYIIEIKGENDDSYIPVTQISQMGARITSLVSGKTYFVRVIAASGERVGPASDAKSIVVP